MYLNPHILLMWILVKHQERTTTWPVSSFLFSCLFYYLLQGKIGKRMGNLYLQAVLRENSVQAVAKVHPTFPSQVLFCWY